jgi:predicted nucleic acid-binding protein
VIVVDASLLVDAIGADGPRSVRARNELTLGDLAAPAHVDIEILSGLRKQVRIGALSPDRALEGIDQLKLLKIRRIPHEPLLDRIWALRDNLTAPDATYVALAEAIDAPLLTTDARLARAPGSRCEIRLIS